MVRKIITSCIVAGVAMVAGKLISDYAETKPALKNVKDKLKKTGEDLTADCKEVLDAACRVFTGEEPDEGKVFANGVEVQV